MAAAQELDVGTAYGVDSRESVCRLAMRDGKQCPGPCFVVRLGKGEKLELLGRDQICF